jgi:chromosome segregation ATPase
MIDIATAINSFASEQANNELPKTTILLSIDQLQDLITAAITRAVEPLQARIEELEEKVQKLEESQQNESERVFQSIAEDRRRISAIELQPEPAVEHGSKVKGHLNEIYDALQERAKSCANTVKKWDFMTFWEAEKLLDLSHRRISQLAEIAKNDPRFVIGWHPKKHNTKIIKLNPFRSMGHAAAFMNELSKPIEGAI